VGSDDKMSKKKLKKIIRRCAFHIIEFCRKESKKLKKRNEYQIILFPNDYEYEESD
jgi:arsenate reductase-like glutaredoxin family protein